MMTTKKKTGATSSGIWGSQARTEALRAVLRAYARAEVIELPRPGKGQKKDVR